MQPLFAARRGGTARRISPSRYRWLIQVTLHVTIPPVYRNFRFG
jgi:hypothetical protein